jgi:hypothetical protein
MRVWLYVGLFLACLYGLGQIQQAHAQQVRIRQFTNHTINATNFNTRNFNRNLCLYRSAAPLQFSVTATGTGAGGAFTLSSGGNTIPYLVFFNNNTGTTGEQSLTSGIPRSFTLNNNSTQNCTAGNNGNYHVRILGSAIQAVPAGTYTGTLQIMMAPN